MTDVARVVALEASCRAALPALHEERVGGWLLRVSGGDTKRVNSANPVVAGVQPIEALAAAEALYAAHGLPCRFRLTPLAARDADAVLADRGYQVVDRSLTMVAPLVPRPVDPALRLTPEPDSAMLARAGRLSDRTAPALAVQIRIVTAIPGAKAFALLEEENEPIAAGYASIGGGRAQLSDIVVAAAARGRGLGRRLVAGLLGWAQAQSCTEAMLQVLADNEPARRLYRSLAFTDAYPYHYRVTR